LTSMGLPPWDAAERLRPPEQMSALLTREDVRDELRHFLWGTFGKEMKDLGERVQEDIKREFRHLLKDQALRKECFEISIEPPMKQAHTEAEKVENLHGDRNSLKHPGAPDGAPVLAWEPDDTELIELHEDCKLAHHGQLLGSGGHCSSSDAIHTENQKVADAWSPRNMKHTVIRKNDEVINYEDSVRDTNSTHSTQKPKSQPQDSDLLAAMGNQLRRPLPSERARPLSVRLMKHRTSHEPEMRLLQGVRAQSRNGSRTNTIPLPLACVVALHRAVKHEYFDYIMGIFLILNALSIGWQVDYLAGHEETTPPGYFRAIEAIFCIIFALELAARLLVYGRRLYRMPGWQWNVFDTLLVIFQIIDELTMLLFTEGAIKEAVEQMGVFRILRLGRVIRLIRMVRLIPELKSMVYLISASMWSFFWTLMLLLLLLYCFAVYYTEQSSVLAKEHKGSIAADIRVHWGSVPKSILTLYSAITGGDDWHNFVKVFEGDSTYFVNVFIFCAYIAFAILVMLNLVTGVFVEGAQRIIKEDKDNEMIRQVCKLFKAADIDGNHTISYDEFQAQIDANRMDDYFQAVELSRQEARQLFKLLDVDRSDSLSVEEFVRGTLRLKGPARSVDLAALTYDYNSTKSMLNKIEARVGHIMLMLGKVTTEERLRLPQSILSDGVEV